MSFAGNSDRSDLTIQSLRGGNSALVIGFLVETNFEASKTLFLKAFGGLKNRLDWNTITKARFPRSRQTGIQTFPFENEFTLIFCMDMHTHSIRIPSPTKLFMYVYSYLLQDVFLQKRCAKVRGMCI